MSSASSRPLALPVRQEGRALLGDLRFEVGLVGAGRGFEAGSLPVGEVLLPRAKDVADPIQRITSISAVSEGVFLDPAPYLVNGEFDHV